MYKIVVLNCDLFTNKYNLNFDCNKSGKCNYNPNLDCNKSGRCNYNSNLRCNKLRKCNFNPNLVQRIWSWLEFTDCQRQQKINYFTVSFQLNIYKRFFKFWYSFSSSLYQFFFVLPGLISTIWSFQKNSIKIEWIRIRDI